MQNAQMTEVGKTMTKKQLRRLINGSKRYEFKGNILTIIDWYDSKNRIQIDFSKMTTEMLEELKPDEEEDGEEEY